MTTLFRRGPIVLVFALLAACAPLAQRDAPLAQADGCVGHVITPPAGLVEVQDQALLTEALGKPAEGKLCTGKVFVATQPVTVYLVYDAAKSYTLYGRWWALSSPHGPREQYQLDNDICPEWSPLDMASSCTVKPGTKIAIGPGQSAQCAKDLLPASATNQVYIPNDSRNNVLFVENCTTGRAWPSHD